VFVPERQFTGAKFLMRNIYISTMPGWHASLNVPLSLFLQRL
jgi:hypothetical protein